jgi:hypothetical protein
MPDALGGMRSGKSTVLRGWTGCGITETLRALITLKGPQWSQRLQWSHWFSGRAQIDEPVGEQAIEDWLRAIAIRPTERLNEGVTRRLRLVSAPAGFGKTTLLNEWAFHFGLATE